MKYEIFEILNNNSITRRRGERGEFVPFPQRLRLCVIPIGYWWRVLSCIVCTIR